MKPDRDQFFNDGFLIIRECIPPKHLDMLRKSFEVLVERQKIKWADERQPGDPPGGVWETAAQPRVAPYEKLIDSGTSDTVEFCLHENTMGVCEHLMGATAGVQQFMLMCSPVTDHGPAAWHRDIHPIDQAPLCGLEIDLLENSPAYLQWNVPLYDDNVLWVVPGSHRRPNTHAENRQLRENSQVPLPKSIPVELKAGDGVLYSNTILHWGSNYSTKFRRTIHLSYRSFAGSIFPHVCHFHRNLDFTAVLSPEARATFMHHSRLYADECDVIETVFRAIIDKDADSFYNGLSVLHPGVTGRMVCIILLSKMVYKMRFASHSVRPNFGGDISQDKDLAPRFTDSEIEMLWQRFSPLDARLQSDEEQYTPGFQSRPMRYFFEEMPTDFGIEDFIACWDA